MPDFVIHHRIPPFSASVPLPVQLYSLGHSRTSSTAYCWDWLNRDSRPQFIFQYTLEGEGALTDRGGPERRVGRGTAMLLTVPSECCYRLPENSPFWEFRYVTLCGETAISLGDALRKQYGPIVSLRADGNSVRHLEELLAAVEKRSFDNAFQNAREAFRFLMNLAEELEAEEDEIAVPDHFSTILRKISRAALNNPDITIEGMRALSGYSPVYFDRLFRRHTGQTPHRFLAELRMRKAVDLLENTLLSVKEVAERCRFRDSAYFCRAFRRTFDRRPGDFRCRRNE